MNMSREYTITASGTTAQFSDDSMYLCTVSKSAFSV